MSKFNLQEVTIVAKIKALLVILMMAAFLTSCSGESFHLRGNVELPDVYQRVYLQGAPSALSTILQRKLADVGSELVTDVNKATAIIQLANYSEGKRIAGYGPNREVRQYLIFIRFDLSARTSLVSANTQRKSEITKSTNRELVAISKVNLDKIQVYDSAFVLGKIEEERLIRDDLRENAARQIMLRLQYGKY